MPQQRSTKSHHVRPSESDDGGSTRPEKARRIRLACERCQRRKIKCDGEIPKCSACQRADAECVDGKKAGEEGSISRSQAASLHLHIRRLEAALREQAPDVELNSLRPAADFEPDNTIDEDRGTTRGQRPQSQQRLITEEDEVQDKHAQRQPQERSTTGRTGEANRDPVEALSRNEAHEIGLVPLSGGALKYVGPSSGLAFTKIIFNRARQSADVSGSLRDDYAPTTESPSTTMARSLLSIEPAALPASLKQAAQLVTIYFEYIHVQHPFLHEPTFFDQLREVYEYPNVATKWASSQVKMVLAISAVVLSRRLSIPYSGEGIFMSAIRDLDQVDLQSSVEGLQCLLLVYMFTLHSPFSGISPWHLNYQLLATVLDLGLQRDIPVSPTVDAFQREMRTRIFWVVYAIDRTLATTLGRPIGLRDEGCDLRLPEGTADSDLQNPNLSNAPSIRVQSTNSNHTGASWVTFFRLAQLNSEIKYILHSVHRNTPRYTYPQITDIEAWQSDAWERLQYIYGSAPRLTGQHYYITILCEIRFHELAMHLYRPTPRIRSPSTSSLQICYKSAERTVSLWKELYEMDRLSYSWVTIHSVCLAALTILYCIWVSAEVSQSVKIDAFTRVMRDASILLSAAGEHWTEARRSRNRLDGLANATLRWLVDKLTRTRSSQEQQAGGHAVNRISFDASSFNQMNSQAQFPTQRGTLNENSTGVLFNDYIDNDDLMSFLGGPNPFLGDNETIMDGMFTDYQPLFNFNGPDLNGFSF